MIVIETAKKELKYYSDRQSKSFWEGLKKVGSFVKKKLEEKQTQIKVEKTVYKRAYGKARLNEIRKKAKRKAKEDMSKPRVMRPMFDMREFDKGLGFPVSEKKKK